MKRRLSENYPETNSIKLGELSGRNSPLKRPPHDLSSVCLESDASFFSRDQGNIHFEFDDEGQEYEETADSQFSKDNEIEDGDDTSSHKRRHKKRNRKKRFKTGKGNSQTNEAVKISVVKSLTGSKTKLVKQPMSSDQGNCPNRLQRGNLLEESFVKDETKKRWQLLRVNWFGVCLYWLIVMATGGLVCLLDYHFDWRFYNLVVWKLVLRVRDARCVLLSRQNGQQEFLPIQNKKIWIGPDINNTENIFRKYSEKVAKQKSDKPKTDFRSKNTDRIEFRVIVCRHGSTYYYDQESSDFRDVRELIFKQDVQSLIKEHRKGLKLSTVSKIRKTFGQNEIDLLYQNSHGSVFTTLLEPLNISLLLYVIILSFMGHFLYALIISLALLLFVVKTQLRKSRISQQIKQAFDIREKVMVLRRSREGINVKKIRNSEDLVPLDVVEVSNQSIVPADMLILHGRCLVSAKRHNSKLSNPILALRSAVSRDQLGPVGSLNEAHILRAGERIHSTINNENEGVFALVIATGMGTHQGLHLRKLHSRLNNSQYLPYFKAFVKRNLAAIMATLGLIIGVELFIFRNRRYYRNGKGVYENNLRIFEICLTVFKPVALLVLKIADDYSVCRLGDSNVTVNRECTVANQLQNIKEVLLEESNVVKAKTQIAAFLLTKENGYLLNERSCSFMKPIKGVQNFASMVQNMGQTSRERGNVLQFVRGLGCCNSVSRLGDEVFGSTVEQEMVAASGVQIRFEDNSKEKMDRVFEFNKDLSNGKDTQAGLLGIQNNYQSSYLHWKHSRKFVELAAF